MKNINHNLKITEVSVCIIIIREIITFKQQAHQELLERKNSFKSPPIPQECYLPKFHSLRSLRRLISCLTDFFFSCQHFFPLEHFHFLSGQFHAFLYLMYKVIHFYIPKESSSYMAYIQFIIRYRDTLIIYASTIGLIIDEN